MKVKTTVMLAFFFIKIVFYGRLLAQQQTTNEQWVVQQTVKNIFDVLSNRDSILLKNYCATDVTFYEYGLVWNIDSMIQKAILQNTSIDFKRENTIDFINTTINGNTAWATYNLHSVVKKEGKETRIHWMETVILIKENNMWRLKVMHSSLINRS